MKNDETTLTATRENDRAMNRPAPARRSWVRTALRAGTTVGNLPDIPIFRAPR